MPTAESPASRISTRRPSAAADRINPAIAPEVLEPFYAPYADDYFHG
jgi:hypothetical protein